jgi:hypothetical protein
MQAKFTSPNPPNKAMPAAVHRRQMIWQVWVPLIASIIVVLALAILAIVGAAQGSSQVERWGNISAVLVILPVLVSGLVILIIVGAIAYGITRLLKKMPEWLLRAQLFMLHLALIIRRVADAATKPVVSVSTFSARVSTFWHKIAGTVRQS